MFGGNSLEMYMGTGIFLEISRGGGNLLEISNKLPPPTPQEFPKRKR